MTLLDDATADADTLFLDTTDGLAQTITQYPGGNQSAPNSLAVLVEIEERSVQRTRGKGRESQAHFWVDAGTTLLNTDLWSINGQLYATDAADDPIAGLIKIKVRQYGTEVEGPATRAR